MKPPDTSKACGFCMAGKKCHGTITAGYYIGGGQWICWLHAIFVPGLLTVIKATDQEMQALEH